MNEEGGSTTDITSLLASRLVLSTIPADFVHSRPETRPMEAWTQMLKGHGSLLTNRQESADILANSLGGSKAHIEKYVMGPGMTLFHCQKNKRDLQGYFHVLFGTKDP